VTDERLHFSNIEALNCFIISASYVASRSIVNGATGGSTTAGITYGAISSYGACLNPAIAVGITLNSIIENPGDSMKWFWLYWLLPFCGSILAIIFYRFVYMKTQLMVQKDQQENAVENAEDEDKKDFEGTIL